MTEPELQELELFAQVDELLRRVRQWSDGESAWEPLNRGRALLRRLLPRLDALRIRLEAPLVVATFGGTGTGKSALVNALVGSECTRSGRERPTTRKPILLTHSHAELAALGLPLSDFEQVTVNSPALRDVVIIDCPDPDTNEVAAAGTNLETLRKLLPYCDVLIYTSTQQKYRSARVVEELDVAATGCRLLFVQTHADQDVDIRDDWRRQLASRFDVPEMFFVDSVRALNEQQSGQRPTGDFARLQDLLTSRLVAAQRLQIRRANLLDLVDAALIRSQQFCDAARPALLRLEAGLIEHRQRMAASMSDALKSQLEANRHLWEQRLLSTVTALWGVSPFSSVLRLYNGLGALLTSASLARARTTAQLVLIGAMHGSKWWSDRQKEREAEQRFDDVVALGLSESLVHEARVILSGHVHEAELDDDLLDESGVQALRAETARIEFDFLKQARERIDAVIERLAQRNSGVIARCWYEFLLLAFVIYVLYRAGRAFFYDSLIDPSRLLTTDFYINAAIFFGLWSVLLIIAFCHRLRRGLKTEINKLSAELANERLGTGLFPKLEAELHQIVLQSSRLNHLAETCRAMRHDLATSDQFGVQKP